MSIPSQADLADVITAAARSAFRDLFAKHPERFYYCTFITTGGGHAPFVCAWSHEALAKKVADEGLSPEDAWALKWSYADSPYMAYGYEEYFGPVRKAFDRRPNWSLAIDDAARQSEYHLRSAAIDAAMARHSDALRAEYDLRLAAMEAAMARLDAEGLFGVGADRDEKVMLAEVMPPDYTNTERAHRLNSPAALSTWLAEAAEPARKI
jgi:Domain of unknown function (DUF4303)